MNRSQDEEISIKKRFLSLKTALSFLLAFLILYYLFKKIDFEKITSILRTANLFCLIIAFFFFYLSILVRGIRWKMLLNNIGFAGKIKEITEILFISWFVNVIVPAKIGDLYRAHLMNRNFDFSTMKSLGTIFTERIFDIMILFVLLGLSGLSVFGDKMPDLVRNLLFSVFIFVSILMVILLIMKKFGNLISKIVPGRFRGFYDRFAIGTTGAVKNVPVVGILTAVIWLLEAGRLYFVLFSIDITLSVHLIIFVALASALLTTLPITPAGLGAVEFAIVGILIIFNVDKNIAVSVAILDRLISYWSIMPLGLVVYSVSKKC